MTPTVPLMLVQGTNDQLVDPRGTYAYYQQVCKAHKPVVYHSINGGDHRDAVRQSPNFSAEFLKTLNNGKIPTSCSAK
jgi:dipeptidyl aminopeptidase/acylaminoacyl peptidase